MTEPEMHTVLKKLQIYSGTVLFSVLLSTPFLVNSKAVFNIGGFFLGFWVFSQYTVMVQPMLILLHVYQFKDVPYALALTFPKSLWCRSSLEFAEGFQKA